MTIQAEADTNKNIKEVNTKKKTHTWDSLFTKSFRNSIKEDENILKLIILFGCAILGSIITLNIFQYEGISLTWKVAIITFIIILPISFFLQPLMTYNYLKTKRIDNYKYRFAQVSSSLPSIQDKISSTNLTEYKKSFVDNFDMKVKMAFEKLKNPLLLKIYIDIYEKLINEEKDYYSPLNGKKSVSEEEQRFMENIHVIKRMNFLNYIFGDLLEKVVVDELRSENRDLRSYFLPISFFMIIYFGGFLVTIPLINSVFEGGENTTVIPLINNNTIPIQAIQWGFLGGLVYTSINLITRFLRADLVPKVYLYGSYRLLLSIVAAIIVYFVYVIADPVNSQLDSANYETSTTILLTCFAIGISPINFLIRIGQSTVQKVMKWKNNNYPGNDSITVLEGINLVTAERLSEEGIENIQQLAFSNPEELVDKTQFDKITICDWKDQALLYLFTKNILVYNTNEEQLKSNTKREQSNYTLYDLLKEKMGIRTYSDLNNKWNNKNFETLKTKILNKLKLSDSEISSIIDLIISHEDSYISKMEELRKKDLDSLFSKEVKKEDKNNINRLPKTNNESSIKILNI